MKRVDELRDRAGQWRTIAERIVAEDPKAAEALNDLARRVDRQVARAVSANTATNAMAGRHPTQ
jgi:methyl-accepting chemotaxis protein